VFISRGTRIQMNRVHWAVFISRGQNLKEDFLLESSKMPFLGLPDLQSRTYQNPVWLSGLITGLFLGIGIGTVLGRK
jgi:uncharacterized membrane-anchored protein YitT (DUF2179 family)